ncbi:putative VIRB2-interacting protein 2 [Hibiscus syriacus]|uniref:VIRB2-interacting protein 2 n=1 Tax=Hibiscus syriacus TaxID=106335 RepID=A0A6A2ZHU3_HIBSY|nr:putative VIRB2-interacting protein 2 [Hibiscus syriacus]
MKLRARLSEQGIKGPPPTLLFGNIREIKKAQSAVVRDPISSSTHKSQLRRASLSFPPEMEETVQYVFCMPLNCILNPVREVFMFSLGNTQILFVNQRDVVKEITTCTSLALGKPSYQQKEFCTLLGQGILTSNGALWAHQRKILAPELYMDKVKGMMDHIFETTFTVLESWKTQIEAEGGLAHIKIDEYMRSFSGDVISRACFGSSYCKGEEIFLKLRALQETMSRKSLSTGVPGMRYLPTKSNRKAWALEKDIRDLILQVVKERKMAAYEDLLQMLVEGAENSYLSQEETKRFVVDNCKNIYLAGYETTAVSATWCLVLLAANQEWQHIVRKELSMVIQESLQLYPPVAVVSREALEDMKFGEILVPKGVNIWLLVLALHTDPEIWGKEAYTFDPNRFARGIADACKLPQVYMPFGVGPRMCLGQNLALVELKLVIALLLSNFSFSLSPNYTHSPVLRLVTEPEIGVHLLVKKL